MVSSRSNRTRADSPLPPFSPSASGLPVISAVSVAHRVFKNDTTLGLKTSSIAMETGRPVRPLELVPRSSPLQLTPTPLAPVRTNRAVHLAQEDQIR